MSLNNCSLVRCLCVWAENRGWSKTSKMMQRGGRNGESCFKRGKAASWALQIPNFSSASPGLESWWKEGRPCLRTHLVGNVGLTASRGSAATPRASCYGFQDCQAKGKEHSGKIWDGDDPADTQNILKEMAGEMGLELRLRPFLLAGILHFE